MVRPNCHEGQGCPAGCIGWQIDVPSPWRPRRGRPSAVPAARQMDVPSHPSKAAAGIVPRPGSQGLRMGWSRAAWSGGCCMPLHSHQMCPGAQPLSLWPSSSVSMLIPPLRPSSQLWAHSTHTCQSEPAGTSPGCRGALTGTTLKHAGGVKGKEANKR